MTNRALNLISNCEKAATISPCIKTKYCAIAFNDDDEMLVMGINHAVNDGKCIDCPIYNKKSGEGDYFSCPAIHAEQELVVNAMKAGHKLAGTTIAINGMPCYTCAKILSSTGAKEFIVAVRGFEEVRNMRRTIECLSKAGELTVVNMENVLAQKPKL